MHRQRCHIIIIIIMRFSTKRCAVFSLKVAEGLLRSLWFLRGIRGIFAVYRGSLLLWKRR